MPTLCPSTGVKGTTAWAEQQAARRERLTPFGKPPPPVPEGEAKRTRHRQMYFNHLCQEAIMTVLYVQPFNSDAQGFYFSDIDQYCEALEQARDCFVRPV